MEFWERKTTAILKRHQFTDEGRPLTEQTAYQREATVILPEEVSRVIAACGLSVEEQAEVEKNPVLYECGADSVNISLDDVVVKKQKDTRSGSREEPGRDEEFTAPEGIPRGHQKDTRKDVHNTVAHIQHDEKSYTVSGQGLAPFYESFWAMSCIMTY